MPRRSHAREAVLQLLYQEDVNPDVDAMAAETFLQQHLPRKDELLTFARTLIMGVRAHRDELDQRVNEVAEHWTVSRMAVTDRNVLRLGAYELLFTETPPRVVINEAVELAKRFGAEQSPNFVNGILDKLLHRQSQDEQPPKELSPEQSVPSDESSEPQTSNPTEDQPVEQQETQPCKQPEESSKPPADSPATEQPPKPSITPPGNVGRIFGK